MGDKAYAREIARLLDPEGRLFAGRVVSAADRWVVGGGWMGGGAGGGGVLTQRSASQTEAVKQIHQPTPSNRPRNRSTKTHEKGLDVLLASEAHVLILDDTEHVWAAHRRNLIQVGACAGVDVGVGGCVPNRPPAAAF
jgi:hypothetical protein